MYMGVCESEGGRDQGHGSPHILGDHRVAPLAEGNYQKDRCREESPIEEQQAKEGEQTRGTKDGRHTDEASVKEEQEEDGHRE